MKRHGGITVAIDGPAGAGKSTVAREVARQLTYSLVDTGAIYRSVALLARRAEIDWQDDVGLARIVADLKIGFDFRDDDNRVLLAGEDVTEAIRSGPISRGASVVSARPVVRQGLLALQRRLAGAGGAVLEGRDIGTVVYPDAPVKFFLHASDDERARRRFEELQGRGEALTLAEVRRDLLERDATDRDRAHAPLVAAADAILLDTTARPVEEVVATIVAAALAAENCS